MTVRHRQRKGARGSSFLYARGKSFSKPPTFPPKAPEDSLKVPNNPTHAASFSRQFSARTAHRPPRLGQKKGLFAPQRPPTPPFARPNAPFCPGAARFLPGARPNGALACPGFARAPGTCAHPQDPGSPRVCGFFARPRPLPPAVCHPDARRLPRPPPKPLRRAPTPPVAAARRPKVAPPPSPRHTLGAGQPDCRGRLFCFAVEKCAPLGGDPIPGHDG